MQRHSAALVRYLPAHVRLTTIHPHAPGTLQRHGLAGEVSIPWIRRRGPGHYLRELRSYSSRVAEYIRQHETEFDVVYVQGFAAWAYLRKRRIPCVVNPHGLEMYQPHGPWAALKTAPFRALLRYHVRHADRVVSLGGRLSDLLLRAGTPPHRLVEQPNGVDLAALDARERAAGAVERRPDSVLFVGRLVENKGLPVLVEALGKTRESVTAFVVGDGPLRGLVERAGPRVKYLGALGDDALFSWFRRVAAVVNPTLGEGMPTMLLEAMASRTPVIASDVGAVATMFDAGMGRLVPPGSSTALAAAMDSLVSSSIAERAAMGERARQRVELRYDWPVVIRGIVEDLRQAAQ
jgi:glycosyltransferase involved in cell wall biosynthesis